MRYKVTLRSNEVFEIEDERSLNELSSERCDRGFVKTRRINSGYSGGTTEVSILERAVSVIEVA